MKILRLAVCAAFAAGSIALASPAAVADHCSGKTRPYQGQGTDVQVLDWGWHGQVVPDSRRGGVYWSDGYIFADGSASNRMTVRAYAPWHPGYVDVRVDVYTDGKAPVACQHVREP